MRKIKDVIKYLKKWYNLKDKQIIYPYLNEFIFLIKQDHLSIKNKIYKDVVKKANNSFFINKLLYFQSSLNSHEKEMFYYKNLMIEDLRTMFENNVNLIDYNQLCDFCSKKLVKNNENRYSLLCEDNHVNFICCLSGQKITENYAECELCSIFFERKFLDELKILPYYVCFVCQNELYF